MEIWYFLVLSTFFIESTTAISGKMYNAMENEALLVWCPKSARSQDQIYWTRSKSNENITTSKGNRIYYERNQLKFLPTSVNDSGIYNCTILRNNITLVDYVNITIYPRQQDCVVPKNMLYTKILGNKKRSRIYCPTIEYYNTTGRVDWFKNCNALKEQKYYVREDFLIIQDATVDDSGNYTCKFIHSENGVNYYVTATRPFIFEGEINFSIPLEIIYPRNQDVFEAVLGTNVSIKCSACLGKGSQMIDIVKWKIEKNGTDITSFRFHEEIEAKSSGENLNCKTVNLKITNLEKEDLSLDFYCVAINEHRMQQRSVKIILKKENDQWSTYYIVLGFSILPILIIILTVILKVFWIDFILLWREVAKPYKIRNDGKIYDAYVIYPRNYKSRTESVNSMEYFVHHILPDVLERKCGYNLCIYGRDLLPGEDAASEIVKCIQKSRRQIIILNPLVEHGEEFAYEQETALHCALIQNDSKVILVEMETTGNTSELQDSLKHIIKKQGTIKWKGDHAINKKSFNSNFWKHVRYQMPLRSKSLDPFHNDL